VLVDFAQELTASERAAGLGRLDQLEKLTREPIFDLGASNVGDRATSSACRHGRSQARKRHGRLGDETLVGVRALARLWPTLTLHATRTRRGLRISSDAA
jgi:hypothetical protein